MGLAERRSPVGLREEETLARRVIAQPGARDILRALVDVERADLGRVSGTHAGKAAQQQPRQPDRGDHLERHDAKVLRVARERYKFSVGPGGWHSQRTVKTHTSRAASRVL
mmetsp:Transcript_20318/g.81174  ORF Transcript_20318/g.81174 Transcript_20318/m.81174 type:complete len:111 (+) Transcript_20318:2242-2574(+)